MKSKQVNKVTMPLGNKPMILHAVHMLEELHIQPIVVVIGFAKESVSKIVGNQVILAEQRKRLGTAHAVSCGLQKLPQEVKHVLIIQGDDSAFYKPEVIYSLISTHIKSSAAITFLTLTKETPFGLGRVVRSSTGAVVKIVEEKDATPEEKLINEINPACYVFSTAFLKKYIKKVKKSSVTGEYYLTQLIDLAIGDGLYVETVKAGNIPWRGVNTPEELQEAHQLFAETAWQ